MAKQVIAIAEMRRDDEFERLTVCEKVPLELRAPCVVVRRVGGMRTSDVHAWT